MVSMIYGLKFVEFSCVPSTWLTFVNISCKLEKDVYYIAVGYRNLYIYIHEIELINCVVHTIPYPW